MIPKRRNLKARFKHSPALKSEWYKAKSPERVPWSGLLEVRLVDADRYQILLNHQARYGGRWLSTEELAERLRFLQSIGVKLVKLVRDPGRVKKTATAKPPSKPKLRRAAQPFWLIAEENMF